MTMPGDPHEIMQPVYIQNVSPLLLAWQICTVQAYLLKVGSL